MGNGKIIRFIRWRLPSFKMDFSFASSEWQLLSLSLCPRAVSPHQLAPFLGADTSSWLLPGTCYPLHPVTHLPRAGCITGWLVAIQEPLGPFNPHWPQRPNPAGVSPSDKGSFRFPNALEAKCLLCCLISGQMGGLYFLFSFVTELVSQGLSRSWREPTWVWQSSRTWHPPPPYNRAQAESKPKIRGILYILSNVL